MVKIDFFPEAAETPFKPNYSSKLHKYPLALSEDPFLELILKNKQDFTKLTIKEPVSLEQLINENIELKQLGFPKREVLGEEFTDEDYEKLCSKMSLQNDQFKKHQMRDISTKVTRIKSTFIRLTLEEIFTALKTFDYNEEEASLCLTKSEFISQVRNQIAQSRKDYGMMNLIQISSVPVNDYKVVSERESEEDDKDSTSESDEDLQVAYKVTNQKRYKSSNKKCSRLKLDDALATVNESGMMEGWSLARVRAYQGMKKNPNAYYYRFNAPGETQRNGPWSREEEEMFMKRLAEVGADGQWGIFSIVIPGRVGYQCSNYYRKLIETGKIKDSNYKLDEKGKAHFIGGKTRATLRTNDCESEESECSDNDNMSTNLNTNTNTRTNTSTSMNKNVDEIQISSDIHKAWYHENPLPGFIDAITQKEVNRPAISPYGHVLNYDTWMKCLLNGDRKNICPLTNQPLHKRQLIFLTFENIEMYRDKIRKINGN